MDTIVLALGNTSTPIGMLQACTVPREWAPRRDACVENKYGATLLDISETVSVFKTTHSLATCL